MDKKIISARIHQYQKPLSLDNTSMPKITHGEEVIVKVGATGLCHSDLHLMNGEWRDLIPLNLPKTPGHEVAGWVEETGKSVPTDLLQIGDLVVVFGGWGCGICTFCKSGDDRCVIRPNGQDYRPLMEVTLNLYLYHHIDFL
ncbi:MAG: alcohol dehydrogenase catalytic domain-containing protein [Candidatus Nitrosocosmicus sp.]